MIVHVQGSSAYAMAIAKVASGKLDLIGERYDEYGRHVVAVQRGGYRRNDDGAGMLRIGSEYFSLAIKDYRDWPVKWWREAIQNSVDAGAKHISMASTLRPDGLVQVSCEDDGSGMSRETLLERFLVLGGSGKSDGSTIGGFGKAKELLILPWISWKISSSDYVVEGNGATYTISDAPERKGTLLEVVMSYDKCTRGWHATQFLSRSHFPGIVFTVDGERVQASLTPGKLLRELESADIYYNPRGEFDELLVRVGGLFMFDKWISKKAKGTVIVELKGPSTEVLTANRDGFRDWRLSHQIEEMAAEIAADTRSALRGKRNVMKQKFEGHGSLLAMSPAVLERVSVSLVSTVGDAAGGVTLNKSKAVQVADQLPREDVQTEKYESSAANERLASAMLTGTKITGSTHASSAAKVLVWEPDFFIWNEIASFSVPQRFLPSTMSRPLVKLARLWAELCRFVIVQLGGFRPYGVGWVFDESAGAAYYRHDDGSEWLLLNPFVEPKNRKGTFSLSNPGHVGWLYAAAIHEVTHMTSLESFHNEDFAAALTNSISVCYGKEKQVRAIRRAVVGKSARVGAMEFEV